MPDGKAIRVSRGSCSTLESERILGKDGVGGKRFPIKIFISGRILFEIFEELVLQDMSVLYGLDNSRIRQTNCQCLKYLISDYH